MAARSLEAAKELGQPPQLHLGGGSAHRLEQRGGALLESVVRKSDGDHRIVVRPDRSVVIRHRVVAGLTFGNGPYAPARMKVRRHQLFRHAAGPRFRRSICKQNMAGIRRTDTAQLAGAVDGDAIDSEFLAPEVALDGTRQPLRLLEKAVRHFGVAQLARGGRDRTFGGHDIGLNFDQRDGPLG